MYKKEKSLYFSSNSATKLKSVYGDQVSKNIKNLNIIFPKIIEA